MSNVLPVDATITIRAETSVADPDTCKFTVSRTVHPGGPFFFHAKELAAGSPLAERLFRNSWTGKSTVPSRRTAGRFPLST